MSEKKLCKSKEEKNKNIDAKYICKKCGNSSNKENKLCKPKVQHK